MVFPARFCEATATSTPTAGTLYIALANTQALIKKLTFTNTSAGALTLSVYLVASGGTAGDTNAVRKLKTLAVNETFECYEAENHVLAAGDFIAAAASGAGIVAHASGLLIT